MLALKDFINEELKNVKRSLQESLRHEYGSSRSSQFYDECLFRLDLLGPQIASTDANDYQVLATFTKQLSKLSALITRIERSHLGEFSWPFADAFERIAVATCHSFFASSAFSNPLFFISAGGGIESYRIYPEQSANDIFDRQIFNIVFPRSLKYHVLLHPILGHELGHAIWRIPDIKDTLTNSVIRPLFKDSLIGDIGLFKHWLASEFQINPAKLSDQNLKTILGKWEQEFLCDLFGLVIMGPCFYAAHRSLLHAMDPSGKGLGESHPPNLARYWMLDVACDALEWRDLTCSGHTALTTTYQSFWNSHHKEIDPYPGWARIFKEDRIRGAVESLYDLINDLGNCSYSLPDFDELSELIGMICRAVPPTGTDVDDSFHCAPKIIDFRTILFSGWLAWHSANSAVDNFGFFNLNRLCNHAILQQEGIRIWTNNKVEQTT